MMFLGKYVLEKATVSKPDLKRKKRAFRYKSRSLFPIIAWVVGVTFALYPIYVYPLYNKQQFQEIQKKNRSGIDQEKIQPGGMRVWSDPFAPKPEIEETSK